MCMMIGHEVMLGEKKDIVPANVHWIVDREGEEN